MKHLSKQLQFVNDVYNHATDIGIIRLKARKDEESNRVIHINDNPLVNFATNNFLGFENDPRVKEAAIEGINRYGLFTSVSRTYFSYEHYLELEEKLEKIFDLPVFLANNTSQGHFSYLPLIIGKNDAIITDQFLHASVQVVVQYLKGGGVYNEMIRHNQMDALEARIKVLSESYDRIWYFADSVYSMHGDMAPMKDIESLLNTYDKFHAYIDDAHGMSWIGKNGKGFCLHHLPKHEKLYAICSLNKGFGATSAALVFPNQQVKDLVHNCGFPVIFSSPTMHAGVTAASKIADIHLSVEIYEKQIMLGERIEYFNRRAKELNLPLANFLHTPIFYLGLGSLEEVFRFSKHLQSKGFIMSVASAPSVPLNQSGLRFILGLHQTIQDIENLVCTVAQFMEDLEKSGQFNREIVLKAFRKGEKKRDIV
ncbi:8-amino-7-oxononanoate synthase [Emticicia aquatica]|jgi:glycine C-acetyltransferase|uniref:8-amino-7-oxononanoate synthase n=1 Tax=Emticicia aquatica TaxID=1681835 RepID=A0ABN8ET56_9BACT|nr:aminotransferase class I/II-fold pyridoxal phosphate-dependent enzyme [Emticicia aquatica]CAH0994878.1 8-amino-7-oxononanoate synthase [Emticicia aquatica]